ncbi:MAG TPA: hypothetical protein VFB00_00655, partial [Terriglobales bacterium]|nr:hypothetical protein [Terriglobales bacterium]
MSRASGLGFQVRLAAGACTFGTDVTLVPMEFSPEARIAEIYKTLAGIWGPQHWWPAQSRFEVIVGAYLTQNTSWSNVELAMRKLRAAGVLSVKGIRELPVR